MTSKAVVWCGIEWFFIHRPRLCCKTVAGRKHPIIWCGQALKTTQPQVLYHGGLSEWVVGLTTQATSSTRPVPGHLSQAVGSGHLQSLPSWGWPASRYCFRGFTHCTVLSPDVVLFIAAHTMKLITKLFPCVTNPPASKLSSSHEWGCMGCTWSERQPCISFHRNRSIVENILPDKTTRTTHYPVLRASWA